MVRGLASRGIRAIPSRALPQTDVIPARARPQTGMYLAYT